MKTTLNSQHLFRQKNRPSTRTKNNHYRQRENTLSSFLLVDRLLVVVQQLDLVVDGLAEFLGGRQRDRMADGQRLPFCGLAAHQVTGHHADVVLGWVDQPRAARRGALRPPNCVDCIWNWRIFIFFHFSMSNKSYILYIKKRTSWSVELLFGNIIRNYFENTFKFCV